MKDSGKVVLALLAGIGIGAALGILFAPDKGEETRQRLADSTDDLQDDLEQRFDDFIDGLKEKFSAVKDEAEKTASDVKNNVENGVDKAQHKAGA